MDLSSIKPGTVKVPIKHPGTGEATGLVISFMSVHDPAAAPARRTFVERGQRKRSAEQRERDAVEFMAALATGWEWGKGATGETASWGGVQLPFNHANAVTVLSETWLRAQIDGEVGDIESFFQK